MRVEVPAVKRCCFCIPLRYGIITCGYIRLVLLLLMLTFVVLNIVSTLHIHYSPISIVVMFFLVSILLLDICCTIVYLIGGHLKTAKLLHVAYIGNIVIPCMHVTLFVLNTGHFMYIIATMSDPNNVTETLLTLTYIIRFNILFEVFYIGTLVYTMILLKNETNKLNNRSNCRFVNNAAEAESYSAN